MLRPGPRFARSITSTVAGLPDRSKGMRSQSIDSEAAVDRKWSRSPMMTHRLFLFRSDFERDLRTISGPIPAASPIVMPTIGRSTTVVGINQDSHTRTSLANRLFLVGLAAHKRWNVQVFYW